MRNLYAPAPGTTGLRPKAGFTLIEVVIGLAVLAVLAALFMYAGRDESPSDREIYDEVAGELYDLTLAIAGNKPTRFQTSFRWVIGVYPEKLSDLTSPITTAGKNICGVAYASPAQTSRWVEPFWNRVLQPEGAVLSSRFTAKDTLVRLTAVPTPGFNLQGTFAIRIPNVVLRDAQGLDLAVDGTLSGTAGTVRYAATDPTTVDYYVLISGC